MVHAKRSQDCDNCWQESADRVTTEKRSFPMNSRFQPVRVHASVHDDEPCQCQDCVAFRRRLTQMVMQTKPLARAERSVYACR